MTKINTANIRYIRKLGKVKTGLNSVQMGNVLILFDAEENSWKDALKKASMSKRKIGHHFPVCFLGKKTQWSEELKNRKSL